MPRLRRKPSEHGTYHIMMRGINRQNIFEDDEDKERFLETVRFYKKECGFTLYAWCLMNNHVHMVMKYIPKKEEDNDLKLMEVAMKKIGVTYAYYFNKKYKRSGHLFQDRFKSEVVNDDAYLYTVVRYVHCNPVKADMVKKPEEYEWSSYRQYVSDGGKGVRAKYRFADTDRVLSMHGGVEFVRFTNEANADKCLEDGEPYGGRLSDDDAKRIMYKVCRCKSASDFQKLSLEKRREKLAELHDNGLNINQISRLTGIVRTVIYRAIAGEF